MKKSLTTLAVAVTLFTSLAARAQSEMMTIKDTTVHESRPTKVDITGMAGFFGFFDVGVAGWYSFPIVKDGFIPPLNDSFNVELGAAFDYAYKDWGAYHYNHARLAPMGGVRWDFYLNKSWTVFAKAKAGLGYRFGGVDCGTACGVAFSGPSRVYFAADGGAGAYWNMSEKMALRMEFGYLGVAIGLSINM